MDNDPEVIEAQRRLDEAKARAAAASGSTTAQGTDSTTSGDAPADNHGAIPSVPRER